MGIVLLHLYGLDYVMIGSQGDKVKWIADLGRPLPEMTHRGTQEARDCHDRFFSPLF